MVRVLEEPSAQVAPVVLAVQLAMAAWVAPQLVMAEQVAPAELVVLVARPDQPASMAMAAMVATAAMAATPRLVPAVMVAMAEVVAR